MGMGMGKGMGRFVRAQFTHFGRATGHKLFCYWLQIAHKMLPA